MLGFGIEAFAIVRNDNLKLVIGNGHPKLHLGSLGMAFDIVQGLFDRQKQTMA